MVKKPNSKDGDSNRRRKNSGIPTPIWVAIIGLIATLGAAIISRGWHIWPFDSQPPPRYEAWMVVKPNPVIRGQPASLQFYFNNSSANRVTLTRMIAADPCDPTQPKTTVEPSFPGWKGTIVEPQVHDYNFYGAEHAHFPYSCGAASDNTITLSYKFELLFTDGEHSTPQVVAFEKTVFAYPQ